jgi:hypothetical protein
MLFLKGKHLAEGLRRIGEKHNLAVLTATQTDKAVWGANDIDLKNMPESKAIAETADSVWAIIRNSEMKKNNKIAPADDAGENELDSVVTKDTKNSGAIPAVIVFEDDEFYQKWSGPIILGPFTLALFSLIVIGVMTM